MLNLSDLYDIPSQLDAIELYKREKKISFDDATNIQFTSGTTGFPKGATLSHHNILNNALFLGDYIKITEKDRIVIPVPLYHCFGMVIGNLVAMNFGAAQIYASDGFDAAMALEAVSKYDGSAIYGVPTMFMAYLDEYQKNKEKYDIKHLRTGYVGGANCPEVMMYRVINEMGIDGLSVVYG
mmetsp:Transcript_13950/g.13565  ORF Transcript_13950/g.13565 Transcript_13950/m.13565 type:complete len:182 (-) Transcript_13950:87-632(-)